MKGKNTWKIILITFGVVIFIGILAFILLFPFYGRRTVVNLSDKILELNDIRESLSSQGKKDFAYRECVVEYQFIDSFIPWRMRTILEEYDNKISFCRKALGQN